MSQRRIVKSDHAPEAIGPYSQAIVADHHVYTSGQIALDPESGAMVGDGDIRAETKQVLANLEAVLGAAGSSLHQVLRCDVFLADMGDFAAMNDVYATAFDFDPPARVTIQAAGLPMNARVEIAAVARLLD